MAYRRSLTTRANFVAQRYHPSVCHILRDDDRKQNQVDENFSKQNLNHFLQRRFFGNNLSQLESGSYGGFAQDRRFAKGLLLGSSGFAFSRYMSTSGGVGSDKFEIVSDVAEVITDSTVQAAASQIAAANEVAIAAQDSFLPVQLLQYVIDGVHCYTGLNWWAAIALTTLMIRSATLPLLINQLKATSKLTLMRPHLEEIKQQVQDRGSDPIAVAEGQKQMQKLFKEYGVSPFTPMKGLFIQGPIFISFFLAISNMAEKVPSFKSGGAYWFVDLTTQDSLYIFPVLAALSFLLTVECNMQEGMEGNPAAKTMKNVSRVLAILTVPFTMSFPKAIFCYWVTSNTFSLLYGLALKYPGVKKFLGVPEIPVPPPSTAPQSTFSFSALKEQLTAGKPESSSSTSEPSKLTNRTISSSSVISQRLRSLEKQVKGKKKNKKR
ncbi:hypothetical protein UlMin_042509 [Ulmus minor]